MEETEVAELERKIGQQAMEIDFLKGCLRQIEDLRKSQAETANPRSAESSSGDPSASCSPAELALKWTPLSRPIFAFNKLLVGESDC